MRKPAQLPREATESLARLSRALGAVAAGQPFQEVEHVVQTAVADATSAVIRAGTSRRGGREQKVAFTGLAANQTVVLRRGAGITQQALAEAMTRVGFTWGRVTVAEVENGTRKISNDEIVGLSALFGVPVLSFLTPGNGTVLRLNDSMVLTHEIAAELLIGRGGHDGGGGADWESAATAAGAPIGPRDWRPARPFWERQKSMGNS